MKTAIVAAAALLMSSALYAQDMTYDAGRTTFGIRAGVNFQNINGKTASGAKLENDILTGFHAGVNAEIPLGTGFYLQPGVLYSQKGTEFDNDNQVKLNYLEVPVNFVYKPVLGTGRMLLGFGPYVGFGIGGKVKTASTEREVEFEKAATGNPSLTTGVYKKLDAGANFLAGYEFARNLSFQVNAQLGLVNINPDFIGFGGTVNDETKWRNTGFGVSLGYRF
jgi:hypothetical protein